MRIDCPMGQAIGVKEWLAVELERFGDTRVVRVAEDDAPEQEEIEDWI